MNLVKWLIDEKKCALLDRHNNKSLTTQNGLTPVAVAAMKGHLEIMSYLVHEKKCPVTDINDIGILQRALHVALKVSIVSCVVSVSLSLSLLFHLFLGFWSITSAESK
jgi:hypothetical protein